jgi:flagellar biosynthetic protein FliR
MPPVNDMAQVVATLVADGFRIGVQLAAPFLVVAMIVYAAMGLMSRLMPQMMIFFVALPAQILTGITVLMVVFSSLMLVWMAYFQDGFIGMLG